MRNTLLAAFGAAALLSGVMLGNPVKAMTFAAPSAIGIAAADAGLVKNVHYWGYYHRPYWGYYHRPYWGYYRPYYGLYGYYQPYGYYRPYGWYRRWYW